VATYLHDGFLVYLDKLVDWERYFDLRRGGNLDVDAERDAMRGVLDTCAEICASIEPASRAGWEQSSSLSDDHVTLPKHVQEGYDKLKAVGLVSLGVSESYGGFDLPSLVSNMVIELVSRADASLMTIIGLQSGVAEDIQKYASEELKQSYLPRFASGEVMGAMDLTEPQAGSDLGAIITRATERDGQIYLDGQKIFITNGGCEVHLVLARDDDNFEQSKGTTRGLSLYLCPRTLDTGEPNQVHVERLEHKMGLHGSPTAAIRFDGALAFRIGQKGEGFKAMLDLMNNARLGVAAQGLGIAEAALEEAMRYSGERVQFGVSIGSQPLMKNMLARMVLDVEAARALLYRTSALIDHNRAIDSYLEREEEISDLERSELEKQRERNGIRTRLLTPLAKYWATEACDRVTRMAIQIHGGNGFMAESVPGKLHLDGIITTIYEGTSEIQVSFALKEIGKGALNIVFDELRGELKEFEQGPLAQTAAKVMSGIERIEGITSALASDFSYALLCSRSVAEMVITVIVGSELIAQAAASPERTVLAESWVNRKLLELEMHAERVSSGGVERIERCENIVALFE
jgi:alkylation response protein AidB-like acyl-CoA dehydrogenase